MKIIVRIPTEQYAYLEAHYDSIEDYKENHPKFAEAVKETKQKIKKQTLTPVDKFKEELI